MPELISVDPQALLEQVNSIMEEELGEILAETFDGLQQ